MVTSVLSARSAAVTMSSESASSCSVIGSGSTSSNAGILVVPAWLGQIPDPDAEDGGDHRHDKGTAVQGRDHALTGAVAFAAAAPLLHLTALSVAAGTVLTAGAALLPDIDEPGSTISRQGGFLTMNLAWIVHRVSGGHRKGTHSFLGVAVFAVGALLAGNWQAAQPGRWPHLVRSEEHTSELQSQSNLVCRLLLEKKK